jgi:hypothetical protein
MIALTGGLGSVPVTTGGGNTFKTGVIVLDNNKWMNIAIPVIGRKVKEYFVDVVLAEVQTQTPTAVASDIFEVCKAFPASDESTSKFLVYVPDVTPAASAGNFNLVTTDGDYEEINGMLVKMKDYSGIYSGELEYRWTTEDDNIVTPLLDFSDSENSQYLGMI